MDNCILGELIRTYREQAGLSREEVAGDFCSVSTLTRIEGGEEIPGRLLAEELCSSLGLVAPNTNGGLLSKEEAERSVIEWRIKRKIERKEFDYEDLLEEYRECGETNSFERQIHDLYLSLLLRHKGKDDSELFGLYTESISLTLFSRTEAFLPKRNLLSKTELLLLRQIAVMQHRMGRKDDAIAIIDYLDRYYERGICLESVISIEYPKVLRFVAEWKLEKGDADSALDAAEMGFIQCAKFGSLYPFVHLVKARADGLAIKKSASADRERAFADFMWSQVYR